ncbi:hypothetical protein VCHA34P129_20426 [Vibrio chagasii]|nr:hypothetical protein VCHA34P129_20426 [Vibrio chagasii]
MNLVNLSNSITSATNFDLSNYVYLLLIDRHDIVFEIAKSHFLRSGFLFI